MRLKPLFAIATPHAFLITVSFTAGVLAGPVQAQNKVAVFEFELQHGAAVPGVPSKEEAEARRREMTTQRLREHLASSGFEVIDATPMAARVSAVNLQACGDCAADFARELGADYAFTAFVYKVSELVLSMSVRVHAAANSQPLTSATVDIRGNTDESWRRGLDYLYGHLLAARLEKLKQ